ncbi:hypothetical protein PTTG_01440 [Puccinia triticina 1-1 BBBD Race 1]|uniref:C3HC-type domain-containing protein n=2 Tax=Puccinia triticina TaxID=208348 RepID=A0A0C4EL09_PUCT1|nr:uncharacterized protein PtA15_9A300 [Puccinia triticina]OAV99946.1 hypothetical protein PTTG_01440 [Puccinia triticina 1-1 BBBD Race 1]WAQ88175.1 hypothetical protein PtA15_9A300 [Puccinia triticina]WAR60363.1 hypothetical protein PtB15_9B302 [Puccinia triticina]
MTTTTNTASLQTVPISPSQLKNALDILNQIDCPNSTTYSIDQSPSSSSKPPVFNSDNRSNSRLISTPALEAIRLSRVNGRTNSGNSKRLKTESRPRTSSQGKVNPSSQMDFLRRLETFKLSSYPAGKPRGLSPPSMAAHGWTNVQKNRLKCICCGATWVLATPSKGDWSTSSGAKLAVLGIQMRTDQHRNSCPWRSRSCPPSIYRIPRCKSSRETFEALIKAATEISDALFFPAQPVFQIQHTLPDQVVTTLSIALQSQHTSATTVPSRSCPTTDALILALFGWSIKRVPRGKRDSSQSVIAQPSVQTSDHSVALAEPCDLPSLYCRLCHRQALPSPTSTKSFNPIHEHREYCPFIDPHAGFDPPPESAAPLDSKPGWKTRLGAIQNVLDRRNFGVGPSSAAHNPQPPLNQAYMTLENLALHFNAHRPAAHTDHLLGPDNTHTQLDSPVKFCPQINLLNFVKEVLAGPPSQLLSSS